MGVVDGQDNYGETGMNARIIDGKALAGKMVSMVTDEVAALKSNGLPPPGLAVVLVGHDPASGIYVRNKVRQTHESGMMSIKHELPSDISQAALLSVVEELNTNPEVHGILVQLPLPPHIDPDSVINAIDPNKDVDGFHVSNVGRLATGQKALVPCTPFGCLLILREHVDNLAGKNAVVIGRSNIVGKPMANLLLRNHCTVTVAHSRTADLPEVCRRADILVAAVGRPEFVHGDWVKPGAVVVDVGINRVPAPERGQGKHRVTGDVDFRSASKVAGYITPVPGGVGPMTIACLLANTLTACCRSNGIGDPKGLTC